MQFFADLPIIPVQIRHKFGTAAAWCFQGHVYINTDKLESLSHQRLDHRPQYSTVLYLTMARYLTSKSTGGLHPLLYMQKCRCIFYPHSPCCLHKIFDTASVLHMPNIILETRWWPSMTDQSITSAIASLQLFSICYVLQRGGSHCSSPVEVTELQMVPDVAKFALCDWDDKFLG